jgi:hypothetical protein
MRLGRREFVGRAGAASAGLLLGQCAFAQGQTAGVTLHLLLWGSALYAFSNSGRRLEVAYLTSDPHVPGCSFVPHRPSLRIPPGGGRFVSGADSTFTTGDIPVGAYAITTGGVSSNGLDALGLNDSPAACVGGPASISSLGYIPSLATASAKPAPNWRDRFAIRFTFDTGQLKAHAPFHGEQELAQWEIRGPSNGTAATRPFTDTLELVVPLPGDRITFGSGSSKVTIASVGNSKRIDLQLLAHPVMPNQPDLKAGDPEPHFCALYALYDPIPGSSERAELFFNSWCVPQRAATGVVRLGPSPGKYCTGAKVML